MGYGHPDTGKAYSRARELCHDIGEAPQLFPVLHGLWEFLQNQGELESAVEVGEQMLVLAKSMNDPGLLVAAHGVMADNLLCVGDPAAAREHAAQAIALYDPDKHQSLASMFGYDSGVAAHCMTALALWQAGYPDQAVRSSNAAADLANSLSHPPTLAFGAFFASWIRHWTGAQDVSQKMADRCVEISTEFDLPALLAIGQVGQGWASIAQGQTETGMVRPATGVEGLQASGFIWARSFCLGVVAEGCAGAGRLDEALAVLEEAFAHADGTGERFFEAELLRLKGEYLLRSETRPEPTASEGCFLSGHRGGKAPTGGFLGTPGHHESGAAVAGSGPLRRGPRVSRTGLLPIHRGLRDLGCESREGASYGVGWAETSRGKRQHDRHDSRPLPHHRGARRRRDGGGVARDRHQARPRGGAEGAARGVCRGPRPVGEIRARGEGAGFVESSKYCPSLRSREREHSNGSRDGCPIRLRRWLRRDKQCRACEGGA